MCMNSVLLMYFCIPWITANQRSLYKSIICSLLFCFPTWINEQWTTGVDFLGFPVMFMGPSKFWTTSVNVCQNRSLLRTVGVLADSAERTLNYLSKYFTVYDAHCSTSYESFKLYPFPQRPTLSCYSSSSRHSPRGHRPTCCRKLSFWVRLLVLVHDVEEDSSPCHQCWVRGRLDIDIDWLRGGSG